MLRLIGTTFLVAAFIVAAYIAWLLWGTGVYTAREQSELRTEITEAIAAPAPEPPPPEGRIPPGNAVAIIEIPSIDLDEVVVEGTDSGSLTRGPGHYSETTYPWQERGRVGIAGHRTTYGAPFADLDKVQAGDEVILSTEFGVFTYEVTGSREILPTQKGVLSGGRKPTLVLTTCTPKFSAARRLVVFADLVPAAT